MLLLSGGVVVLQLDDEERELPEMTPRKVLKACIRP